MKKCSSHILMSVDLIRICGITVKPVRFFLISLRVIIFKWPTAFDELSKGQMSAIVRDTIWKY